MTRATTFIGGNHTGNGRESGFQMGHVRAAGTSKHHNKKAAKRDPRRRK
jgi:hypothetical protein